MWDRLAEGFRFVQGSFDDDDAFDRLEHTVADLDRVRGTGGNHAFYLSIPPGAFPVVCKQLARSGLSAQNGHQWRRVVIEKPFGHDLKSAIELNGIVNDVFPEDSVFRIDHYLGKETVQNILAMRFANQLFEPIWNAHYVDHVQITMAEDIGLGGRAGYYDGIGAARDVIQNHLLQLLAFTAMEEPVVVLVRGAARREDQGPQRDPARRPARRDHRARPVHGRLAGRRARAAGSRRSTGFNPTFAHRDVRGDHLRGQRPAAGPGCRSTCAPASGWGGASPRSRWCSSARRTCRSTRR